MMILIDATIISIYVNVVTFFYFYVLLVMLQKLYLKSLSYYNFEVYTHLNLITYNLKQKN